MAATGGAAGMTGGAGAGGAAGGGIVDGCNHANWTITASVLCDATNPSCGFCPQEPNLCLLTNAIDGDASTRYTDGRTQAGGEYVTLAFNSTIQLGGITMLTTPASDAAKGYKVEYSIDGINYQAFNPAVAGVGGASPLDITFPAPTLLKAIKITQTGAVVAPATSWWSISEITPIGCVASGVPLDGKLEVQRETRQNGPSVLQSEFSMKVINTGTSSIPLNAVSVRYWYTIDGTGTQSGTCTNALHPCSIGFLPASPAKPTADEYAVISFFGGTLLPGEDTGEVQVVFQGAGTYDQTNDYSFTDTGANFLDAGHLTAYLSGKLVWGTPP
jgi:hypothetical protein